MSHSERSLQCIVYVTQMIVKTVGLLFSFHLAFKCLHFWNVNFCFRFLALPLLLTLKNCPLLEKVAKV